ncbi:MAG: beta-fructosidase, partial [Bacillus sp. (in: firmicutes)]
MKPTFIKKASVFFVAVLLASSVGTFTIHPTAGWAAESKEGATILESGLQANTNLTGWQVKGKGSLEDTQQGLLLTSEPNENVMAISSVTSQDFIYEADIQVIDRNADATLVFRSNEDGWDSYMLQIVPNAGMIRLRDARDETRLKEEYPVTLKEGGIYHLKVKVVEDNIKVYWGNKYEPVIDVNNAT